MWIIGDVHGQFETWIWILQQMELTKDFEEGMYGHYMDELPASVARQALDNREAMGHKGLDCSLQLGDFGIFFEYQYESGKIAGKPWPDPSKHKFFRGNHDNPNLIKDLPGYLGDWGYNATQNLFWLAGGWSIDRKYRTEGIDWWADEELSNGELTNALALYEDVKPRIMITHEAPTVAKNLFLDHFGMNNIGYSSQTEKCLQMMWDIHKPDIWVFGHFHRRWSAEILAPAGSSGSTKFECLGEMINGNPKDCIFEIPGLTW